MKAYEFNEKGEITKRFRAWWHICLNEKGKKILNANIGEVKKGRYVSIEILFDELVRRIKKDKKHD